MTSKATYSAITESELIFEVGSVFKKYANSELRFYENGLAVWPVKFVGAISLQGVFAEAWHDIKMFSFGQAKGIYRTGEKGLFEKLIDEDRDQYLYVETKGLVKRCVNHYGMSVFGLMGFHLNNEQVETIKALFQSRGVEYKALEFDLC